MEFKKQTRGTWENEKKKETEGSKPSNRLLTTENKLRVAGGKWGRGMG